MKTLKALLIWVNCRLIIPNEIISSESEGSSPWSVKVWDILYCGMRSVCVSNRIKLFILFATQSFSDIITRSKNLPEPETTGAVSKRHTQCINRCMTAEYIEWVIQRWVMLPWNDEGVHSRNMNPRISIDIKWNIVFSCILCLFSFVYHVNRCLPCVMSAYQTYEWICLLFPNETWINRWEILCVIPATACIIFMPRISRVFALWFLNIICEFAQQL